MAIADLVVTVFSIPVELITAEAGPKWLAVNILTGSLSAIAVDRFLLMFHLRKKIITPRAAKLILP
ncbi:hypothetical protein pdam_00004617 [Pocillopora damicornis]|uniref:Uncharacterized protein n=1 Tax=Pocillopora damicornis TaxID=46731 RepID=A0A3M6ULL2_POCDA|nr:hypothetical protein pdam_00004617 [Pocillopora damicornis]